jgi:hypothetical protein
MAMTLQVGAGAIEIEVKDDWQDGECDRGYPRPQGGVAPTLFMDDRL